MNKLEPRAHKQKHLFFNYLTCREAIIINALRILDKFVWQLALNNWPLTWQYYSPLICQVGIGGEKRGEYWPLTWHRAIGVSRYILKIYLLK